MSRGVRAVLLLAILTVPAGCGDGTPSFCEPLAEAADLSGLTEALDAGDLDTAGAAAAELQELAAGAPEEIRTDLTALADSVADIVALLAADAPERGEDDVAAGQPPEVERRRNDLNSRFADLDRRSTAVTTWAARECGLDLT